MTDETKVVPKTLSDEELLQLAQDLVDGRVFTSHDVLVRDPEGRDMLSVFMPLFFGGPQNLDLEQVGLIYEYIDKAGPRAINGMPCFFSMKLLNRDQTVLVFKLAKKLYDHRQAGQKALLDSLKE